MSRVTIDVARESTLEDIYSKVEEGAGIWCKPKYIDEGNIGGYIVVGKLEGTSEGTVVINYRNKIYVVPDNKGLIADVSGFPPHIWKILTYLPFKVDVHETCFVVFNDEIHILGGDTVHTKSHYKWDGEKWSIASELPYDFCNGKATVYQNKIHIFGGGTEKLHSTYGENRLNNHYCWDGETWTKASDLPYPAWGCTPFVCNGKLHLVGGGIYNDVNYNNAHYVWDGISWSKKADLPFTIYNGSTAKISESEIYVLGGADSCNGRRQNIVKKYNGASWSDGPNLPAEGINNTGLSATVNSDRQLVVSGHRTFTLINGKYVAFLDSPGDVDRGYSIVYKNDVYLFFQKNQYKWVKDKWEKVSTIPFNFVGGSAVVYQDKIHLLGSASSGVEDYHYTWSPDEGWVVKQNLPEKFSNGTAIVYNDELHIIGGTFMNGSAYNHYKLVNARWEVVGHTIGNLVGTNSAVVNDGLLYAATQDSDDGETISPCTITVFDGIGWTNIGEIDTQISADNYHYLVSFQNRLHFFMINDDKTVLHHYLITGLKKNIGHAIKYGSVEVNCIPCIMVANNRIFIFCKATYERDSMYTVQYNVVNTPLLEIYLPKNHQIICNKEDLLPIIGEVEETESGYRALSTGLYTFVNYTDNLTIS